MAKMRAVHAVYEKKISGLVALVWWNKARVSSPSPGRPTLISLSDVAFWHF
jgi:hypothetical protein